MEYFRLYINMNKQKHLAYMSMFSGMKHVCFLQIFNYYICVYYSYIHDDDWSMFKCVRQVSNCDANILINKILNCFILS